MNTPDNITELKPNEIFVFGSNLAGSHAGGAAKQAYEQFGAEWGIGEGLTGQCYAFPTLDEEMQPLSGDDLIKARHKLYSTCRALPEKTFFLTKVGCGLAGFSEHYMKGTFAPFIVDTLRTRRPANLIFPKGW